MLADRHFEQNMGRALGGLVTVNVLSFVITIAGVPVGINTKEESILRFCSDYLSDMAPEFVLEASNADIDEERALTIEHTGRTHTPKHELERMWIYRTIAERLPAYDAILMHASAVALDGKGYLFLGPSGAGKSTQSALWRSVFGNRLIVINGDKPFVRLGSDGPVVYGTPWCGKEGLHANISAPLCAIIRLEHAEKNSINQLTEKESWDALMDQMYVSRNPSILKRSLEILDGIISSTPVYRQKCTKDESAVFTAYNALKNKGE